MKNNQNLIWIDLEMTGLKPQEDKIIEIATVVTDANLNILAEGPVIAIHQPESVMNGMDDWNTRQHNKSGLVTRVLESTYSEAEAEQKTLEFLSAYVDPGKSPMCGNSVCQDKQFLCRYMPKLTEFFHYRQLDVSSIKELVIRWRPQLLSGFIKQSKHLALMDIKESIEELAYYRQHFINTKQEGAL